MNNNDCGVFVCKHIDNLINKDTNLFEILDGEYRPHILNTLKNKTLTNTRSGRSRLDVQIKQYINNKSYDYLFNNIRLTTNFIEYSALMGKLIDN